MKTIEITIGVDGKVQLNLDGFQGTECEEATRELLDKLGQVEQQVHKTERWVGKVKSIKIGTSNGK